MSLSEHGCPCCQGVPAQRSSWKHLCDACFVPWSSLRECDGRGHRIETEDAA